MTTAFCTFAAQIFMRLSIKNISRLVLISFVLTACGKKEKELTPAQIRAKADSIVQRRMEKLRRQAKDDLDNRLPIEIKPKMDSLRKASDLVQPVPVFPGDEPDTTTLETAPAKK